MSKSISMPRKSVFMALSLALALGSLALPAGTASAQTRQGTSKADSNTVATLATDKSQYEKKTRYDFDDDEVEGTFARPDDLQVLSIRKGAHESMVKPRASFLPELVKSVEAQ